jgi:hypothetical protein
MTHAMRSDTPLISVIIPNYNYEAYVGAAIDSALALEWPRVEVIVIDDGSTDGSRRIIESYGDRIQAIYQENSGQLVACNKGYALSRGQIVIFLDSDDVLRPALAREIVAVWSPSVSKVQVQMQVVDARGEPTGAYFPQYHVVPTPKQVSDWARHTTAYPTPPGSGNAYSRWFLDRIFPLHNTCGTANDSYCLAAAPLLGDVVTIAKPLVAYRVHGKNQGAMAKLDLHQFERQMTRARQRLAYAQGIAHQQGQPIADSAIDLSLNYLGYRIGSLRLAPQSHPVPDSRWRCLRDVCRAFFAPQGLTLKARVAMLAWATGALLAPQAVASRLILWRFAPGTRPQALKGWLVRARVVRA